MAFPIVTNKTKGHSDVGLTSHPIIIPAGNVGDLILVLFGARGTPAISIDTGISGLNWNTSTFSGVTINFRSGYAFKLAEGSDVLTFNTDFATTNTFQCYRISGATGVIEASATNGSGANANPPLLNPTWGADDTLWLTAVINTFNDIASAAPTDFTDLYTEQSPDLNGMSSSSAIRNLNSATLDPDDFTIGSAIYRVYTLAIQPSPPPTVRIKYWNGSAWIEKPLKRWDGSQWVSVLPKYFDGIDWI